MKRRPFIYLSGAALVVLIGLALAPLSSSLIADWSRHDVELRSTLVFNSLRQTLASLLAAKRPDELARLFESVSQDERVFALALCDETGALQYATPLLPSSISCEKLTRSDAESFSTLSADGRRLLIATFPISTQESNGHFVIAHDLAFAQDRGAEARGYFLAVLSLAILVSGAFATAIAMFFLHRWTENWRQALRRMSEPDDSSKSPLDREVKEALDKIARTRAAIDGDQVQWNQNTLRAAINSELPNLEAIVVANREPYIHNHGREGVELQIPASGVVAALEPVMRACGGTWIAHGSGSADWLTVDADDHIAVPPSDPHYTLRRIWLSDAEQDGYYYGLANEGLWPLCHIAFTRPNFRESDWEHYKAVNQRFAEAVAKEAMTSSPVVLVQDYHFALLPKALRQLLPDATIITFWHIPWPNAEVFGICPWKEEVLEGLLGSSILGFHTQFHCNNFIESIDRFVESRIDREQAIIASSGHETMVRPYPISIEWPPAGFSEQKSVATCRTGVRKRLGLPDHVKIAVGIERFDYTKGILDRIAAVDVFLKRHPEWRGRFVLIQVAAPTRSKLAAYGSLQAEAEKLASMVNEKYASTGVAPIQLIVRHHEPREVFEYFRAADVCVVSSLHDGMNLVAKEFVAARDDEQGVLILSNFAGASRELPEALLVNPYDARAMASALNVSITMSGDEQRERMRSMRAVVKSRNVYRWAGQMLLDASRLRKRGEILRLRSGKLIRAKAA